MRIFAGGTLLFLSSTLIASNLWLAWREYVRKEQRLPSMIPIAGGLLGAMGAALVPALRGWAWLPPLLDPGCAFYLALAVWVSARER